MKLTRKQGIYASVLLVALGALGIDAFSDGADSAAASTETSYTAPKREPVTAKVPAGPSQLAARLAQAVQAGALAPGSAGERAGVADPFADPQWLSSSAPGATTSVAGDQGIRLTSILQTGKTRVAMMDGQLVSVGQSHRGYRVLAIAAREVTLERDGRRSVLSFR